MLDTQRLQGYLLRSAQGKWIYARRKQICHTQHESAEQLAQQHASSASTQVHMYSVSRGFVKYLRSFSAAHAAGA